ncbi:hypothetical protein GW932_04295 [archaeon]|nr:hypothetical protein [archaeon]
MKIGIDLDDTVWKFHEKFFEFYNEKYGTNYELKDYYIYNLEVFLGITREETHSLFKEYESLEKYKYIPFLEGVKEGIEYLSRNFEKNIFLTARLSSDENLVRDRLSKLSLENPEIFYQHDENRKYLGSKVSYCLKEGISVMIDDGYHNLEECSKEGIKCFLVDMPWNQDKELNENIIRVKDWKEIIEKLEEIKNE